MSHTASLGTLPLHVLRVYLMEAAHVYIQRQRQAQGHHQPSTEVILGGGDVRLIITKGPDIAAKNASLQASARAGTYQPMTPSQKADTARRARLVLEQVAGKLDSADAAAKARKLASDLARLEAEL